MKAWTGKRVYISGGTSGIGLEAAERFATEGADLFLFSVDPKPRQNAAKERVEKARSGAGGRVVVERVDVTDPAAVEKKLARAASTFGSPDVLLNSAGLGGPDYFENTTYETFDRMMQVNVYGVRNVVAALLPALKETRGSIINVASLGGLIGSFGYTAYGASKFAVVGFTEALRAEMVRHGIHVMTLCPPPVETPMWHKSNEKRPPETKAVNDGSGLLQPKDVVDALMEGLRRRETLVVPGGKAKFAYHMNRLLPRVRTMITDHLVRNAQKAGSRGY